MTVNSYITMTVIAIIIAATFIISSNNTFIKEHSNNGVSHTYAMWDSYYDRNDKPIKTLTLYIDPRTKDYENVISNDSFIRYLDHCKVHRNKFTPEGCKEFMIAWSKRSL